MTVEYLCLISDLDNSPSISMNYLLELYAHKLLPHRNFELEIVNSEFPMHAHYDYLYNEYTVFCSQIVLCADQQNL
jgi:hypothetical protein